MITKYSTLLPEYLQGVNIRRHASIIEAQDVLIDDKIQLLNLFNVLNRPILVEKIQNRYNVATFKFHINVEYPIKSVKIILYVEGSEIERNHEYSEEDLITDVTLEYTDFDQIHYAVYLKYKVIVETYEGYVYKKGYPENDQIKNDIYDHDQFIDSIGALFGIYRRIYKKWTDTGDYSDLPITYPPYFAKYDENDNMIAGTEDDYYYVQRIKYFIENRNDTFLPALMMKILFQWDSLNVLMAYNRETSIVEDGAPLEKYFYLILTDDTETYINIDDSNRQDLINEYDIITRPSKICYLTETVLETPNNYINMAPNLFKIPLMLVTADNNYPIDKAPLSVETLNEKRTEILLLDKIDVETGLPYIRVGGLLPDDFYQLSVRYEGEYELLNSNRINIEYSVDNYFNIDAGNWDYGKYARSSSTNLAPPRNDSSGFLSVGRNMVTYTPALYNPYLKRSGVEISIIFRYGRRYCLLGVTTIINNEDSTVDWDRELIINPYDYLGIGDYNTPHQLRYRYVNDRITIYLDDTEIKSVDFDSTEEKMFFVGGYSSENENDTNHYGLYFEEIEINKLY